MSFSLHRLLAVILKEFRHITRDARFFFLVTLSPAFLLLVLAYIFAFDVGNVSLGWLDGDRTASSRAYLAALTADGTFRLAPTAASYAALETALLAGRIDVALAIPPGFEQALVARRAAPASAPATVLALADGSDAILASQELGDLAARTAAFGARLTPQSPRIAARTRAWYNPDLKSLHSMVPGLLAIVLTLPALALTLAITREKEVGTLEALIASPVRGTEFLLGKLVAYVVSGLISAGAAAALAVFWFGVPFRGSLVLYLALAVDFYLATMGISLLIAQFVKSQQTAMLLVLFVFFVPGFFVSGLISPVSTHSPSALLISYALPSTHFIAIARGIFLKGNDLAQLHVHAGLLAALAAGSISAGLLVFRKRLG